MSTKAELQKALDRLIGDADEQTQLYESSIQRLYKTLGDVYLWWREARKYEGRSTAVKVESSKDVLLAAARSRAVAARNLLVIQGDGGQVVGWECY